MSIRLLRRFTNSRPRSSTFHALPPDGGQATTKFCEICGLTPRKPIMFAFALAAILGLGLAATSSAQSNTSLAQLAAQMEPGEWRELNTDGLTADFLMVTDRNLSILGWTFDSRWDPVTSQFLHMGFRLQLKFISYSEDNNSWRQLPHFQWPLDTSSGHIYCNNAINVEAREFYHRVSYSPYIYAFDIDEETWSRLPTCPYLYKSYGWGIEYFPEMNAILFPCAWGGIYKLNMETRQWSWILQNYDLNVSLHMVIRHNAKHGKVFLGGGNDRERNLYRIDAAGNAERMGQTPIDLHVQATKLVEDPATGDFIVKRGDTMYAYCIERDIWARLDNAPSMIPDDYHTNLICAPIPEYGVTMWMSGPRYNPGKVWLFKYKRPQALRTASGLVLSLE